MRTFAVLKASALCVVALCVPPLGFAQTRSPTGSADDRSAVKLLVLQLSDFPAGWKKTHSGSAKCLEVASTERAVAIGGTATACAASDVFQLSSSSIRAESEAALFGTPGEAARAYTLTSGRENASALADLFKQGFEGDKTFRVTDTLINRAALAGGNDAVSWTITVTLRPVSAKSGIRALGLTLRYAAIRNGRALGLGLIAGNLPTNEASAVFSRLAARVDGRPSTQSAVTGESLPSKAEYKAWRDAFAGALYGKKLKNAADSFLFSFTNQQQKLIDDLKSGKVGFAGAATRSRAILHLLEQRRPLFTRLPATHPALAATNAQLVQALDRLIRAFRDYVTGFGQNKTAALDQGDKLFEQGIAGMQSAASHMVRIGEQVGVPG